MDRDHVLDHNGGAAASRQAGRDSRSRPNHNPPNKHTSAAADAALGWDPEMGRVTDDGQDRNTSRPRNGNGNGIASSTDTLTHSPTQTWGAPHHGRPTGTHLSYRVPFNSGVRAPDLIREGWVVGWWGGLGCCLSSVRPSHSPNPPSKHPIQASKHPSISRPPPPTRRGWGSFSSRE